MSDTNMINQVFNLDSTSVDVMNAKLEKTYALLQMISQAGAGGNGGGNSAVDVAKSNEKFASRTGFIPNQRIAYQSHINMLQDAGETPISKAQYSIEQYGERQQTMANRQVMRDELSSISLSRDAGYLDRRGLSGVDNRVDAAAGKALLYETEDVQRLAKRDFSSRATDYRWDERKEQLGLSPSADNWDVLAGERSARADARTEASNNKNLRDRVSSARRSNTINDLGDDYAPNGGAGMDEEDIVQATGARAEARRNRARISAEQKRVADVKVVNRGLGARGIPEGEFLPPDASPEEVYAAQQDIRGMGPATKAPPGSPTMKDKWDAFQGSYGGRFTRGALYAAGSAAAEWANSMQNEAMTGRPDFRAQGNAVGSAWGGVVGAAIGSIFPGYGTFIGAGVGMQLGGTVGSFLNVNDQKEMLTAISSQPIAALSYNYNAAKSGNWAGKEVRTEQSIWDHSGEAWQRTVPAVYAGSRRIADRAAMRREEIGKEMVSKEAGGKYGYDTAVSTVEGMAANYEAAYLGLLDAGLDPDEEVFGTVGTATRQTGTHKQKKWNPDGTPKGHWEDKPFTDIMSPSSSTTISGIGKTPKYKIPYSIDGSLTIMPARTVKGMRPTFIQDEEDVPTLESVATGKGELRKNWIAENAEKWFLGSSDEIMKKVFTPMMSALPKTGGNMVDMITQFGGRATAQFEQILTPFGQKPPLDVKQATEFAAGLQSNDRAMQIAQLSVRDSGRYALSAAQARMDSMVDPSTGAELIPGARSSMEYAKSRQGLVSAQNKAWQEDDFGGYNTAAMKLQNQERRYDVNPYSPGNRMAMELTGLGMDRSRIKDLRGREESLRSRGLLSEQQQFDFDSQIEGLETNRQERIGHLVEGVANRLPSLSAGRPSFGNRIDSRQMTAMQFGMIGFPYRGSGAMNDSQRTAQETFLHQFLDPSEINSRSRTFTLNNMGGAGGNPNVKPQMSSLGTPGSGLNGGQISSHDITTVSSPDVVSAIQLLTSAILAGTKGGLAGSDGLGNFISRSTPQPRGR